MAANLPSDWSIYCESQSARFWKRVDRSALCWTWSGACDRDGYGKFQINIPNEARQIHVTAHRFSYALTNGPIHRGMLVCHHCDNPSCVRPEHLFEGTPMDNMRDKVRKGRESRGENHGRVPDATVATIRAMAASGMSFTSIAKEFGVNQSTVSRYVHMKVRTA